MDSYIFYSAVLLGFAGSFHCLGMCGPLAISVSGRTMGKQPYERFIGHLLYFMGKTITYGFLGIIFGLFGHGLVIAGFQQLLSVVMGSFMLLLVFVSLFNSSLFHNNKLTAYWQKKLVGAFGFLFSMQSLVAPVFIGMLNGLLPCGLVYVGLTAAVATGNALDSALYMVLFGLGTVPVMLAFVSFTGQMGYAWRYRLRQVPPVLMAVMGTILILRGLNLGIPYISPLLDSLGISSARGNESIICHP